MTSLFEDFDFSLLSSPDFKEDAVREELIVPLLRELGYSAFSSNKIIRSKALTHPFVYIGTRQHKIHIIPDYLLQIDGMNKWIMDAKAPRENILKGANVEQAFSYSIHPDVRVKLYALCNGRMFTLFHVSKIEPILQFSLQDIKHYWNNLYKELSPIALTKPELLTYHPDFGLWFLKTGMRIDSNIYFPCASVGFIARLSDNEYSIVLNFGTKEDALAISFDFDTDKCNQLINIAPEPQKTILIKKLSSYPFKTVLDDPILVTIKAVLGSTVHSNDEEDYIPLIVQEFTEC